MSNQSNTSDGIRFAIWLALLTLGWQVQCAGNEIRTAINNVAYSCHK